MLSRRVYRAGGLPNDGRKVRAFLGLIPCGERYFTFTLLTSPVVCLVLNTFHVLMFSYLHPGLLRSATLPPGGTASFIAQYISLEFKVQW